MEKIVKFITASVFLLFVISGNNLYAQDSGSRNINFSIPEIALVDIEPVGMSNISLTLNPDTESGLPVVATSAVNNNLWINYTSSYASGGATRKINANISSGTAPAGVSLNLSASAYSGTGLGTKGTSAGTITLSASPQAIITGIGRCYTGDGQNNGHRLTYSLSIADYAKLNYDASSTIQIVFTIADN